jgi:Bax protein
MIDRVPLSPLALGVVLAAVLAGAAPDPQSVAEVSEDQAAGRPVERFEFSSYQQVDELFKKLDYTPEAWQAGIREVPRAYLTTIPPRWRDTVSKEVSTLTKKRIFFRALAPLALHSNELISRDRELATAIGTRLVAGEAITDDEKMWLAKLAAEYKVIPDLDSQIDKPALHELMTRVDIVPLSLVLSQCAEESGWGTSRFAAEGNALFGQWSWGGKGIKPEQQREGMGDYRIAAFETPLASVMAYMMNLNTHSAYAPLRVRRAAMRAAGQRISGWILAETLDKYSERGPAYVESLHGIMRVNKLDPADDAYLGDGPTIFLIPVDKGVN